MEMSPPPRILRKSLLSGAHEASGVVVVIDVLRAFTSAAFMMYFGATEIVLLADPDEVLTLKEEHGHLAVGEVDGVQVPGFDLGNAPSQVLSAGRNLFAGRAVAQRTSAGVTGAVAAAPGADLLILGSYVTASATARYIQRMTPPPQVVSLVAMGLAGREPTPDDERCADYIEHLLDGTPYDHAAALQEIVEHGCTQKFLRGDQPHYPAADPIFCLHRDLFDFVLIASVEEGRLVARRKYVRGG